jgi:hypothetical protein
MEYDTLHDLSPSPPPEQFNKFYIRIEAIDIELAARI